jgi:basic membrane lipoprotein Med (substrate-binding protein (PBP1-ABC) superfamily)
MRNSLWSVIAIVSVIMGFLMGYATAPMIETGMLMGRGGQSVPKTETVKELEQYYEDLYKEK